MSIGVKIIALSAFLAAIFLGLSFGYVVVNVRSELTETTIRTLEAEVVTESQKIEVFTNSIRDVVLFLKSTPPIQGMIRAQKADDGVDEEGNSTFDQWKDRLETIFSAEMESAGIYDQLRYIDEAGQEVVRVDFVDGVPRIIPENDLQNKSDREYFLDTNFLANGQVYVSRSELNREGQPPAISVPYRPVIRYATPVFDETTGERRGLIIANILIDEVVTKSKLFNESGNSDFFITNTAGFFIVHPDQDKEWGSPRDLDTGHSIFTEFPAVDASSFDADRGTIVSGEGVFAYAKTEPDETNEARKWIVIEYASSDVLFGFINTIVENAVLVGFTAFIFLFFVFLFVINKLLSPLDEVAKGAGRIGQGDFDIEIPVQSKDEIGQVAKAFNTMKGELKKLYTSLEDQVQEKTKDLNEKVGELEKAQSAMANILEDVEEEKEKAETILQSIADGVFVVDANLNIVLLNDVATALADVPKKDAVGALYRDVFLFEQEDEPGKANDSFIEEALKTGRVQSMEGHAVLARQDGTKIPVAQSAAPLFDKNGSAIGVVIVFRDITKEYQVDRAKTEFVSLASHQLRTPLSSIGWYAEMLLSGDAGKISKQQQEYLNEIYEGNKRMVDLVNALLNVSRLDLGTFIVEPEPTDILAISDTVLKEMEPKINEKQLHIEKEYAPDLPKVNVDPKLTRVMFQNLISNAVKYTSAEGSVYIIIDVRELKKEKVLFISVADTGIGIPKKQQKDIFTKLFRADNVRENDTEGTGLGLYIIKSILDQSGGKIWFESEEGKGTTFFITLPLEGMKKKEGTRELG